VLEADLATEWAAVCSIEYLQTFERQVTPDVFFENLVEDCSLQDFVDYVTKSNHNCGQYTKKSLDRRISEPQKGGAYTGITWTELSS
jgi:hypothetical protein